MNDYQGTGRDTVSRQGSVQHPAISDTAGDITADRVQQQSGVPAGALEHTGANHKNSGTTHPRKFIVPQNADAEASHTLIIRGKQMKENQVVCADCLGLTEKCWYWHGRYLCEDCYKAELKTALLRVIKAKQKLCAEIQKIETATAKTVQFSVMEDKEIYIFKGIENIARALEKEVVHETYSGDDGYRDYIVQDGIEFYEAHFAGVDG